MRSKTSHAAKSGVGEHTARESESAQCVPMGKSAWRAPTPEFGPGTARFRGLIRFWGCSRRPPRQHFGPPSVPQGAGGFRSAGIPRPETGERAFCLPSPPALCTLGLFFLRPCGRAP